ncbi:SDR family NAD(P)-dependent oxidoreductase [Kineococcus rhizosphaerae]|uniref:NAD(P)-dependent dehydrogenase (Short-subunit alcohol dehydrogenase family) n=1 Tax=Kineococcus rhizosphaerae TaxID=559628 RepID=A0A2T0R2D3_9ACTN|nr:SDR family NAD(P)-dependent oxidoreductase [Kineococcus rhizosphaerae]PRY13944.1 NAD(P)-dependent dehydrogenase (short-subunit alcohol dehydrogenase family) [Kineococcus rhizosphaerae]
MTELDPTTFASRWTERPTPGRFTGKTVIVTGAGSGIGRATAARVIREGGHVVGVDIDADRLDGLLAEVADVESGGRLTPVGADITDDASIASILQAAAGQVDALANIAGIMDDMSALHDMSDAVWQRVFAVNVEGTMKLMRAVLPGMLERGAGSIVNTASEAALRGSAAGAAYTASKHAVAGLTMSGAFMYAPNGIRINAVAPGPTMTGIEVTVDSQHGPDRLRAARCIMPAPVMPNALAASITWLLSDDAFNVNGAILASDGGWSAA